MARTGRTNEFQTRKPARWQQAVDGLFCFEIRELLMNKLLSLSLSLRRSCSGTALTEFAISFPVLILMYVGVYSLSDALACNRKVTIATRAVTDLTTRYPRLSDADLDNIMNASMQIMLPYPADRAQISISQVKVINNSHATVIWSNSKNTTPLSSGTVINIPNGISTAGTYLIIGSITYNYVPPVNFGIMDKISFTDKAILRPRLLDQIPHT